VTLGKLSGIVQVSDRPEPLPAATTSDKPVRKGRNDAGKKRGSYKNGAGAESGGSPDVGQATTVKVETPAPPVVTVTPAEQASPNAPTAADAQKAMEILFNAKGFKVAQEMVLKHGAPRVRDLPIENRLAFIREAAALADAVNSVGSQP